MFGSMWVWGRRGCVRKHLYTYEMYVYEDGCMCVRMGVCV